MCKFESGQSIRAERGLKSDRLLGEIGELLRLDDGAHCKEARLLAEQKLNDVREKLADLSQMETVLAKLVRSCRAAKGKVSCPLIATLYENH